MTMGEGRPVPAIYHGGDTPEGGAGVSRIWRAFNLPDTVRVFPDLHERMIADDLGMVEAALQIRLGLSVARPGIR